jgi:uncharacterized membrane protein
VQEQARKYYLTAQSKKFNAKKRIAMFEILTTSLALVGGIFLFGCVIAIMLDIYRWLFGRRL